MACHNDMEVEADRRAAEESGCSVTLRSNNAGSLEKGKTNEVQKLSEEETKGRGHGPDGGRRRPRGPRPGGAHGPHGSRRDNHAAEFDTAQNSNSDKFVSTGIDSSLDKVSSSRDWVTGRPPEVSASHNSPRPRYNSQGSRESNQGQRSGGGRGGGHPRPKYVTVPDALHSHDVRHVEQVNDSIVVNIDRSAKPISETRGRGRRGGGEAGGGEGGGSRGASGRSDFSASDFADLQITDRDAHFSRGDAALRRGGYRERGGRRPFRGQGQDGSYRGQGRGDGGFRRGRGDGPRPFRGGYRRGRTRDGRGARHAVIHVVTSSGGDVGNPCAREEGEDWDKEMAVAVSGAAAAAADGGDDHGWPSGEGGDVLHQEEEEEQQNLDDLGDGGRSHACDESPLSGGACDNKDGIDPPSHEEQRGRPDRGTGGKTECLSAAKGTGERDVAIADGKEGHQPADVKARSPGGARTKEPEGVKSDDGVEVGGCVGLRQNPAPTAEAAEAGVKVGDKVSPRPTAESAKGNPSGEDAVVGNIVGDVSTETADNLKKVKSHAPIAASPVTAASKSPDEKSDESKISSASLAKSLSSPGASSDAGNKSSVMPSGDTVSEIPAVVVKET